MKLLSLFSGIGAFERGFEMAGLNVELVNYCEFDKYASKSYAEIHGVSEDLNLGDITEVDERLLTDFDLMTYGFPCQDISVAGKQAGISEGTRSGLLYEALRIAKHKKPKVMIAENVKALVSKKFKPDFEKLLSELEEMGYNNYWKVLNAKDYGIPQNRERVFIISIRKDIDNKTFEWPEPYDNGLRLKDFLEDEVEEKYYLNKDEYEKIQNTKYGTNKRHENKTKKLINGEESEFLVMDYRYDEGLRVRENQLCPTLTTRGKQSISGVPIFCENGRLRFIIPLECWRLMGFKDEDFEKARATGILDNQLYKQAGNSIVTTVIKEIAEKLKKSILEGGITMLYFNNPGAGECVLLEEVNDLALVYRERASEYVVVSGLDKKTFEWNHGHYFGPGIAALARATEYLIKESCR